MGFKMSMPIRNLSLPWMITALSFISITTPSFATASGIVINAVGDIMLAGKGTAIYEKKGYDHAFSEVARWLRNADVTVGNLEAPITLKGKEFTAKRYRFRSSPKAATALRKAGFSVLTLANNHIMDFGAVGLRETLRHLDSASILYAGAGENLEKAGKAAIIPVKKKKVAFLAYSLTFPPEFFARSKRPGTAPAFGSYWTDKIAEAKAAADYVVVSFHWGAETETLPKPYQVETARKAIRAGADVVIGHHPHVLQGMEFYNGGVIFYSLGNFAFGSMSPSSNVSIIARITLEAGVKEVELIPLNVLNSEVHFQPKVLSGKQGHAVIRNLNRLSAPMGLRIRLEKRRYIAADSAKQRLARN